MNVLVQYNKSLHVRGPKDSYSMHIDYGNTNVFMQYNYSEDCEGGFVEILGENMNSVYRFNVSVNDGFRDHAGNTIWVSDYAGTGNRVTSNMNYIYNNSVYVSGTQTPDISINGENTFIYNNIFYTADNATIGEIVEINTASGSSLEVSNNLFFGDVRSMFTGLDMAPVLGDPFFMNPGASNIEGYRLTIGSIALNAGISFIEPLFPAAGKGIFKDVPRFPVEDIFGNPASVGNQAPHIGAYNGAALQTSTRITSLLEAKIYIDNLAGTINIEFEANMEDHFKTDLYELSGRSLFTSEQDVIQGRNELRIPMNSHIPEGVYILSISNGNKHYAEQLLIHK